MEFILNDDGIFENYDDTYDVIIHCDSQEAHDEVLADLKALNDRFDVLDKIKSEIEQKCCITVGRDDEPAMTLYDVFHIIDKYRTESEEER